MSVYEVRYRSNGILVKGYLGLPLTAAYSTQDDRTLEKLVRESTGAEVLHCVVSDIEEGHPLPESPQNTYPALLYCRGGIGRVGMSRLEWIVDFCRLGYVVFAPWYRGTLGTPGRDEFGGQDCEDSDAGLRLLQTLPFVHLNQVDVMGFSRGSINAAKTAVRVGGLRRLILWGGIASLAQIYDERVDLRRMLRRVIGGTPTKVPNAYYDRSPIALVDSFPCPVRIVHSTHDLQVPFHHGQDMVNALRQAGAAVDWHFYDGYGHHFHPSVRHAVMDRMRSDD